LDTLVACVAFLLTDEQRKVKQTRHSCRQRFLAGVSVCSVRQNRRLWSV